MAVAAAVSSTQTQTQTEKPRTLSDNATIGVVALGLLLFWIGTAAAWAPLSTLLLQNECTRLGLDADQCQPNAVPANCNTTHNDTHDTYTEALAAAAQKLEVFTLVQGASNLVSCPVIGPISNSFGRKPACILVVVSGLCCALAVALISDFNGLLAATSIFGLGGGMYAFVGTSFSIVADVTCGRSAAYRARVFGMVEACLWVGLLIGPTYGGLLADTFGPQKAYLFISIPFVLCLVVLTLVLPETVPPSQRAPFAWKVANPVGALHLLTTDRTALFLASMCFLALTGSAGGIAVLPLYCQSQFSGWKAKQVGYLMTIMFASSGVGLAVVLPVLIRVFSAKWAVVSSMCASIVTWVAAGLVNHGTQLIIVMCSFSLNGLYFPILRTTIAGIFGPKKHALALGAVATLQQVTATVAPPVFTRIYQDTLHWNVTITGVVEDNFGPRFSFAFLCSALTTLAVFFALLLPNLEEEQRGREAGVTRAAPTRQIQLGSGETAPLLTQLET